MRLAAMLSLGTLCLGLTGCYGDPFQNPNQWSMNGASREDIAQQAANKDDLLQGRGDTLSNGIAASAAVDVAQGGATGSAAGLQKTPKDITFSTSEGQ